MSRGGRAVAQHRVLGAEVEHPPHHDAVVAPVVHRVVPQSIQARLPSMIGDPVTGEGRQ